MEVKFLRAIVHEDAVIHDANYRIAFEGRSTGLGAPDVVEHLSLEGMDAPSAYAIAMLYKVHEGICTEVFPADAQSKVTGIKPLAANAAFGTVSLPARCSPHRTEAVQNRIRNVLAGLKPASPG